MIGVNGFKGSEVPSSSQDWILGYVFARKASALSGLIQNLEPNWKSFWKISIFNKDPVSLILSLALTLNVEP